jgi:hypothetical protein
MTGTPTIVRWLAARAALAADVARPQLRQNCIDALTGAPQCSQTAASWAMA